MSSARSTGCPIDPRRKSWSAWNRNPATRAIPTETPGGIWIPSASRCGIWTAFCHLSGFRYHDDGMAEIARAACRMNAVNWASMGSEEELEHIFGTDAC